MMRGMSKETLEKEIHQSSPFLASSIMTVSVFIISITVSLAAHEIQIPSSFHSSFSPSLTH
jgi:hypothetical protein